MTRLFPILTATALLAAGPALAHPGHVAETSGHDHLIALGALAIGVAIALWACIAGLRQTGNSGKDASRAATGQDAAGEGEASRKSAG